MQDAPEVLDIYTGADEEAAYAKACEVVPGISRELFATYRTERIEFIPETKCLLSVFQKMGEDIVFAAKVEDCEDIDSLYRLCKQYELATITRDQFASIYVQFRLYILKTALAMLTR